MHHCICFAFSWIATIEFCARFLQSFMFFKAGIMVLLLLTLLEKAKQSKKWKILEQLPPVLYMIEQKLLSCQFSVLLYIRRATPTQPIRYFFQFIKTALALGPLLVFQGHGVKRSL